MTPEADILEHLSALGEISLTDALRQVPDRLTCLRAIDDLRQRGLLTLWIRTDDEESPTELWHWREVMRNPQDLTRDLDLVLKKTPEGVNEWWKLYDLGPG